MKIYFESLGCPKARVETEMAMGILALNNHVITNSIRDADLIFLTTCSFIDDAKKETLKRYKELRKYKKKIIFFGCFVDEEKRKIFDDKNTLFIGTSKLDSISELINKNNGIFCGTKNYIHSFPRILSTFPYSYIKVSEGCSNRCSYCIIPYIRGDYRERNIKEIIDEAKGILSLGIKEIILISQDLSLIHI